MKTFSIGDRVKVVGPSRFGCLDELGKVFAIDEVADNIYYSTKGILTYPASSLELVKPGLQVGDWAEVIGPDYHGCRDWVGNVFKIERITPEFYYTAYHVPLFPKSYLRKLPDSEIAERLNQNPDSTYTVKFNCDVSEFTQKLKESHDKIAQVSELVKIYRKLDRLQDQIDKIKKDTDRRLDAGEHRSANHMKRLDEIEKRLRDDRNLMAEIESRLDERIDNIPLPEGQTWEENIMRRIIDIEKKINHVEDKTRQLNGTAVRTLVDIDMIKGRLAKAEHRLDFVEMMQRDQTERKWWAGP